MTLLTPAYAATFAELALRHVQREYPNKLDHVINGPDDVRTPAALHPLFCGSFDWHSCVHGYWLLARLHRRFPVLRESERIRALFDAQITSVNVDAELAYLRQPNRGTFERPYGWAWLLMLAAELERYESAEGGRWATTLAPLAREFARRFTEFLPKATYPIRAGTHFNTAFAFVLAFEYCDALRQPALAALLRSKAVVWYGGDADCQAWEPSGDDFLSPALIESVCMQRTLSPAQHARWLDRFLPRMAWSEPSTLFTPATVSDRTDGKIAHLDGLNFSRAWCWRLLSRAYAEGDERRLLAEETADAHLRASLPYVAGDYMGEHWLATFALLALEA